MKIRILLLIAVLLSVCCLAASWGSWNGKTVGSSTGNISAWNGVTIGRSAGNIGSFNGLTSPGGSPPSLVAHTTASSASSDHVTTASINTTSANFLAVVANNYNQHALTITSSPTNTWTCPKSQNGGTAVNYTIICYAYNPTTSATQTFTATGTSGDYITIFMMGFSNMLTSSSVYQTAVSATSSDGSHCQTGSITPVAANEVFITGLAASGNNGLSFAIDSSFNTPTDQQTSGNSYEGGAISYYLNTGTGALDPTWTITGTVNAGSPCIMGAFRSQ